MERIIETGPISRNGPESAIGWLSFTQTSVFGGIFRAAMAPLYTKLHLGKYHKAISLKEATSLSWRTVARARVGPRKATPKHQRTERIAYSDASGKSQITATARLTPETSAPVDRHGSFRASKTSNRRCETFEKTCYIYGIEVLGVLETLLGKCNELRRKSVTCYIDNINAPLRINQECGRPA